MTNNVNFFILYMKKISSRIQLKYTEVKELAIILHGFTFILQRVAKCPKHPIHPYREMAIVMPICGMVNGVVASPHDRPQVSMNTVMNICSPNAFYEYHR